MLGGGGATALCVQGRHEMVEVPGSVETFEADLIFLAMGFTGPEALLSDQFGLEMTAAQNYRTARSARHSR